VQKLLGLLRVQSHLLHQQTDAALTVDPADGEQLGVLRDEPAGGLAQCHVRLARAKRGVVHRAHPV
jgi:hypothetical protein